MCTTNPDCTELNQVCNTADLVCECDTGFAADANGDCKTGKCHYLTSRNSITFYLDFFSVQFATFYSINCQLNVFSMLVCATNPDCTGDNEVCNTVNLLCECDADFVANDNGLCVTAAGSNGRFYHLN